MMSLIAFQYSSYIQFLIILYTMLLYRLFNFLHLINLQFIHPFLTLFLHFLAYNLKNHILILIIYIIFLIIFLLIMCIIHYTILYFLLLKYLIISKPNQIINAYLSTYHNILNSVYKLSKFIILYILFLILFILKKHFLQLNFLHTSLLKYYPRKTHLNHQINQSLHLSL